MHGTARVNGLELYKRVAYDLTRRLTLRYSSSFGLASRLFASPFRRHIYAVYGMVRIADEIVDSYTGADRADLLANLEADVLKVTTTGTYSANPIVHAFGITARATGIGADLITPFFDSMRIDIAGGPAVVDWSPADYQAYIYGSAEVVGLMCLKIFCDGDEQRYGSLVPGARALGRAYQKVNFLRDFADDYQARGRIYFPGVTVENWDDESKSRVILDIKNDFTEARQAIADLPAGARSAVYASYLYYDKLLTRLAGMSARQILAERAHIPTIVKLGLLLYAPIGVRRK